MTNNKRQLTPDRLKRDISNLFGNRHTSDRQCVGIEVEFAPFKKGKGEKGEAARFTTEGKTGVLDMLVKGFSDHDAIWHSPTNEGVPRFLTRAGGTITFEPGGQVEYSSSASCKFPEVVEEVSYYISQIDRVLSKESIWLFFGGFNPWYSVADIGLQIDKERYVHMDRFFRSVGIHGQKMMRLSCSTQVNLDVGREEIMMERWLAGNLLTPVIAAIFGNTPFCDGKNSGAKSYRTLVWQNLDDSRTGFVGDLSSIETRRDIESAYFDFAMNAKVIMLPDKAGRWGYRTNRVSFAEWNENGFNDIYPNADSWKDHLTTLFPNVRPKGFFEFRAIDGQSHIWWLVPTIMLSRLLYDSTARKRIIELLLPYAGQLSDMQWKASIMGVSAFPHLCREIAHLSLRSDQFAIDETLLNYLELFCEMYPLNGRNPADDLLSLNFGSIFTPSQFRDYESRLLERVEPPEAVLLSNRSDSASKEEMTKKLEPTLPPEGTKPCC